MNLTAFFLETYNLRERDLQDFQEALHRLLDSSFVNRFTFHEGNKVINKDYLILDKLYVALSDYMDLAGYHVQRDVQEGVIYLTSEEAGKVRFSKNTTLFLWALRFLFENKRKTNLEDESHIQRTSTREVLDTLLELGMIDKEFKQIERENIQKELQKYHIIQKLETAWLKEGNTLAIFPSILHIIPAKDIYEIENQMRNLVQGGGKKGLDEED